MLRHIIQAQVRHILGTGLNMILVTQSLQLMYFLEIGCHMKTGSRIFQTRSAISLLYWGVRLFPITAVQHSIRIHRLIGVITLLLAIGQNHPQHHFGLQTDSMGHHLQLSVAVCLSSILCIQQAHQLALLTLWVLHSAIQPVEFKKLPASEGMQSFRPEIQKTEWRELFLEIPMLHLVVSMCRRDQAP